MGTKIKKNWRRARWPLAVAALIGGYFWGLQLTGNVHVVVPGELYRTAQPDAQDIALYQKKYGIRTIINLRGAARTEKPWYENELAGSKAAGVEHLDFRMSATHELTEDQARALIAMMAQAPKPLLIHCNAGADRTGLAAALYLLAVSHKPQSEAGKQLWPIYGHVAFPFTPEYAMDRSWDKLKDHIASAQ